MLLSSLCVLHWLSVRPSPLWRWSFVLLPFRTIESSVLRHRGRLRSSKASLFSCPPHRFKSDHLTPSPPTGSLLTAPRAPPSSTSTGTELRSCQFPIGTTSALSPSRRRLLHRILPLRHIRRRNQMGALVSEEFDPAAMLSTSMGWGTTTSTPEAAALSSPPRPSVTSKSLTTGFPRSQAEEPGAPSMFEPVRA